MTWRKVQLRRLVDCLDSRRIPLNKEERSAIQGQVPYWGAGGILDYVNQALFNEPLVLLGEDGAPFFTAGKDVAYYIEGPAWINNHIHALRPTAADGRFLTYALNSVDYSNFITGSTRDKLTQEDLKNIEVPQPPLSEQRRIADFLDAETTRIDDIRATMERLTARLSERRTAGIIAAVSGTEQSKRRESSLPWIDTLPEHWQEVRVGLVARMGSGHTPSRSRPEWWTNCYIPWITTGEVSQVRDDRQEEIRTTRERISDLGLANSSAEICPAGTVVLCRTASAGYSAVMATAMATSQDFVTWTCSPKLNPYYLLWCLRAMRQDLLGRLAMGSTHKTIYVPDLQMLRIPLPPIQEQSEIVEAIRNQNQRIDRLLDSLSRQRDLLNERRQALITAAVTGQIDVSTASGRGIEEGLS
ncbi:restriction endonuclease subunit S [Melissospora conviva]|uniref:restriction endonuclease subunit S n=1 Tax=Melissospora conviva TaxID=3388432 RepID=UPI003C22254C